MCIWAGSTEYKENGICMNNIAWARAYPIFVLHKAVLLHPLRAGVWAKKQSYEGFSVKKVVTIGKMKILSSAKIN